MPMTNLVHHIGKGITYISPLPEQLLSNSDDINTSNIGDILYITCCILTKDEERCIARCIRSVYGIVDEILVIDTGSTDNTLTIIRKNFPDVSIVSHSWNDDFSELRNYGLHSARNHWVLFLDADEYVNPDELENIQQIIDLVNGVADHCCLLSPSIVDHSGNQYMNTRRLLNKRFHLRYSGRVHEEPVYYGEGKVFDVGILLTIHHDGYAEDIKNDKHKVERNLWLSNMMLSEEPNNPKWSYFCARALTKQPDQQKRKQAEALLLSVINHADVENSYIAKSIILLSQIYIQRADAIQLKGSVDIILERKIAVPANDLLYLEMVLHLMMHLNKISRIRDRAEEFLPLTGNSLIHSKNTHLQHMLNIYSFYTGDFKRLESYLHSQEAGDADSISQIIESCSKLLNIIQQQTVRL